MKKILAVLIFSFCIGSHIAYSPGSELYGPGLKLKVNDDGSKYVRFIIWNQIWARSIQNNPGTTVNGRAEQTSLDIGARRARILAYAQVSPRYLVLTHIGINNQTFINGGVPGGGITGNGGANDGGAGSLLTTGKKPGLFFHDVWNEYTVFSPINLATGEKNLFSMAIGAGLHYWHGTSRLTNASTLNFLAIDAPIFNWHTIELSDQFARQFGVYSKGKLGKIDYRFNVSKPFTTFQLPATRAVDGEVRPVAANVAVDNNTGGNPLSYAGYASYQFLDQEANVLPFAVGSYLGTKRVFNIGAGFFHSPDGTVSFADVNLPANAANQRKHDITVLSADIFADLPFGTSGMALTAYGVYYNFNYGPNYLRHVGIMNVGAFAAEGQEGFVPAAQRSLSGPGNGRTLFGTGNTIYTQAGLLLPRELLGVNHGKLQPFAAYTYKQIDVLPNNGHYYDLGFNYLVDGHHAKLTFQYSSRPLHIGVTPATSTIGARRGEFIIQSHIYL
jgi:hypothetical protein